MTIASLPTIPGREACLSGALRSVRHQFDKICVTYLSESQVGLPEVEKIRPLQGREGYLFPIDDDIQYPDWYVERTIEHIERFDRKAVICYAGRRFDQLPVQSYYRGASKRVQLFHDDVEEDWPCHIPIAAAMAWHSDTIKFWTDGWPCPNMDVLTGVQCFDAGAPVICVPHKASDFRDLMPVANSQHSVYLANRNNDAMQTALINERRWK